MTDNITLKIDAMEPEMLREELPDGITMKQTGEFVGMGSEMIELAGPRGAISAVVAEHWGEEELEMHPELV